MALALHRERPVAGALFLHKGTKAIYKFGASDDKFQHLRPTNLVFWESINLLARQGFESLNLGRTGLGNQGLRRFKLSWGSSEETIKYFRFDCRTNDWTTARVSQFRLCQVAISHEPAHGCADLSAPGLNFPSI